MKHLFILLTLIAFSHGGGILFEVPPFVGKVTQNDGKPCADCSIIVYGPFGYLTNTTDSEGKFTEAPPKEKALSIALTVFKRTGLIGANMIGLDWMVEFREPSKSAYTPRVYYTLETVPIIADISFDVEVGEGGHTELWGVQSRTTRQVGKWTDERKLTSGTHHYSFEGVKWNGGTELTISINGAKSLGIVTVKNIYITEHKGSR